MFLKRVTKFMAVSLAAVLLVPNTTAFAAKAEAKEVKVTNEGARNVTAAALEDMEATLSKMESEEIISDNHKWIIETLESILAGETVEYTNAAQVARLVQTGYAHIQKEGPFSFTKATLVDSKDGSKKPVYVIAISGTDTKTENQTTDLWVDLLVGFEKDNQYLQNIKKTMLKNIPEGSNIIVTGHSLGGMVAQQVAAEKELKSTYNFLNTVTFGSPLIQGFDREGDTKRLGDKKDKVPFMSLTTILNPFWQSWGLNKEDGKYTDWTVAHTESYQREDVWGMYDVTGQKNGTKSLILDFSTTQFYHSPVTVTE